jgi:hypothetical protein
MEDSLLGTFVFVCLVIRVYVDSSLGVVCYTMSGNAQRLVPKIGLVESCEKKVCLDVLHTELVIMYKLFMSLRIYCLHHKFFCNMLL